MLHRVQVTDTSQHQLFRGDCVNQTFMVELLQRNHYLRTPKKRLACAKKHEQWTLDRWKSALWSDESKCEIFGANRCVVVRPRVGERMILCMCGSHREAWRRCDVWGCFAGDTVSDLFRIQGTLNQHGYPNILQWYAIPSGLRLVGLLFVFNMTMTQNTPPGCVRAIWPRRIVMECCIRWPGLHNHLTSPQMRRFGMSWTAGWRKSSQQVLSICGNSFKTVGKAFLIKLVERMQSCHQGKGCYFEESKIVNIFWFV